MLTFFNEILVCILEGPEDDSVRVETCCPKYIKKTQ